MSIDIPAELQWISYLAGSKWPQGDEDGLWRIGAHWKASASEMSELIPDLNRVRQDTMSVLTGETADTAAQEFAKLFDGDYSVDKLVAAMSALGETARKAGTQIEASKIEILVGLAMGAAEILYAIAMAPWTFGASLAWIPAIEALTMAAIRMLFNQLLRALVRRAIEALSKTAVNRLLRNVALESAEEVAEELIVNLSIQQYQKDQGHKDAIDWGDVGDAAKGAAAGGAAAGAFHAPAFGVLGGKHGEGGIGNAFAGAGASYGAEVVAAVAGALAVGGNLDPGEIFAGGVLGGVAGGIQSSHGDGPDAPHGKPTGLDGGSHAFDPDDKTPDKGLDDKGPEGKTPEKGPETEGFDGKASEGRGFDGKASEGRGFDGKASEGRGFDGKASEGNDVGDQDSSDASSPDAPLPPYARSDPNASPPPPHGSSDGSPDAASQSANTSDTGASQARTQDGSSPQSGTEGRGGESASPKSPGEGNVNPSVQQQDSGDGQNGLNGQSGQPQSSDDGYTDHVVAQGETGEGQNGQSGSPQSPHDAQTGQNGTHHQSDAQTNRTTQSAAPPETGSSQSGQTGSHQSIAHEGDDDSPSTLQQDPADDSHAQPPLQPVTGPNGSHAGEHQDDYSDPDSSPLQHDPPLGPHSGRGPEPMPHQTGSPSDILTANDDTPPPFEQTAPDRHPYQPPIDDGSSIQLAPLPDQAPDRGQPLDDGETSHDDSRQPDGPSSHHSSPSGVVLSETNGSANQPFPQSTDPKTGTSPPPVTPPLPATAQNAVVNPPSVAPQNNSTAQAPPSSTATPSSPTPSSPASSPSNAGTNAFAVPPKSVSAGLGASPHSTPTAVSNVANNPAPSRTTPDEQAKVVAGTTPTPPPLPPVKAKPKVNSGGPPRKQPRPQRDSDADVSSDETWRHDPATTADWFEPLKPTPAADIDSRRGHTFVQTVDTEVADVLADSTPTSSKSHSGLIRYDLRRIEVAPNKFVQEYTVKLAVSLDADPSLGPGTVTAVQAKVKAAVDRLLNKGNRLPSGDEFRVKVEFTDTDAHAAVKVGNFAENTQTKWRPDASEDVLVHEILHYLGVPDEGRDTRIALRRHHRNSGVHDADGGIMTSDVLGQGADLRPRYLWMIERTANTQVSVPTSLLAAADNSRVPLPPKRVDISIQPDETRRAVGFEGETDYAVALPPGHTATDYDYVVSTPRLEVVLDDHLNHTVLEIVTEPAAAVPGDAGRPTSQQILDDVRDVMKRLREARPGATLGNIFDGEPYSVDPLADDLRVRPMRESRSESMYVHHSVGIPLAGLPHFMRKLVSTTRTDSGAAHAARSHLEDALNVAHDLGESVGWGEGTSPAGRAAAEGFVALVYTQFAAIAQRAQTGTHLTKNFTAMASRVSMAAAADGLEPGVREHLDRYGPMIVQRFAASFRDHFTDGATRDVDLSARINPRQPGGASQARLTLADYLHSAFSMNPDRLVVDQYDALGIRTTLPELDTNRDESSVPRIDPPLMVAELRFLGPGSASVDDVADTHAALVGLSRESFRLAQRLLGHPVDAGVPSDRPTLPNEGGGVDPSPPRAAHENGVMSTRVLLPFDSGSKQLGSAQRAELDRVADGVVERAYQQLQAGRGGLVVRAEGGGNGGLFSRGADSVGRQRAGATLDYLDTQIQQRLATRGMAADAVTTSSAPTSRGDAVNDELSGRDQDKRRSVVLTLEGRLPSRPVGLATDRPPAAEGTSRSEPIEATNEKSSSPLVRPTAGSEAGAAAERVVAADANRPLPGRDLIDPDRGGSGKGKDRVTDGRQTMPDEQEVFEELIDAAHDYRNASPAEVIAASERFDAALAAARAVGMDPDELLAGWNDATDAAPDVGEGVGSSDSRPRVGVGARVGLSAGEFAVVVDEVVPPGRVVDALDCGPLVRALVDRLYGGRVRPLGVSDDVAGVRGGVGGAQHQVVAGGGWAPVNGAVGAQQLAAGLPVGSTVAVMTSPLRGDVGHVVAARVTSEGVRWADPQRPSGRTGTQAPPEVASAPTVWAVVIDPAGRVIDPRSWPGAGGSVSASLPTSVDGLTDKDLTRRFGAHQGHPGTTGTPGPSSPPRATNDTAPTTDDDHHQHAAAGTEPVDSVLGNHVLVPFDPGSKQLNSAQRTQLDQLADRVVDEARDQRDNGHDGLVVHAQGGGNGGLFSRGPNVVGRQRAQATLAYLDTEIQQRLTTRGIDPDAVIVSDDPTSRGKAVTDELTGLTKDKRRMVVVTVQDRDPTDEVLSRLAPGDVVGLIHAGDVGQLEPSLSTVADRLRHSFPDRHEQVESDLVKMVELLESSRITINFTIDDSLQNLLFNSSEHFYLNGWQRGAYPATEADSRDTAERMTGQYGGYEPDVGDESPRVVHARQRVNKYLSRESSDFRPSARPRYGALDYGRSFNGAAPGYGRSFLELKEHVKHRATFTASDSMQGDPTGTSFLGMAQLLARTNDKDFRRIHHLATTGEGFGRETPRFDPDTGTDTNYLEAQLHTPIDLFRDVEALSIDMSDLERFAGDRKKEFMGQLKEYALKHLVRLELRDADGIVVRDLVATLAQRSSSAPDPSGSGPATRARARVGCPTNSRRRPTSKRSSRS